MSLYNMMHGFDEHAKLVLGVLDIPVDTIPRFRDAYIRDNTLVIFTRTGGGNREQYENEETHKENHYGDPEKWEKYDYYNDDLRRNENYLTDFDDEYDATYAHFVFKFPEPYREDLEMIAVNNESYTPTEKMRKLIEGLNRGNETV